MKPTCKNGGNIVVCHPEITDVAKPKPAIG